MLRVYNASAGSGKTHALTLEYLALVLSRPSRARHILAITFTNAATAELRKRVVEQLYELSLPDEFPDNKMRSPLLERGLEPERLTENARLALSLALHRGDTLSVQTIDSFFQRMLRSFGRELALDFGYTVELNPAEPLRQGVERLLGRVGRDGEAALSEWLLEFQNDELDDKNSANLRDALFRQGRKLLENLPVGFQTYDYGHFVRLKECLDGILVGFAQGCATRAQAFAQLMELYSVELDFFKNGAAKTPVRYYPALANADQALKVIDEAYDPLKSGRLSLLLDLDEDEKAWISASKKDEKSKQQQEQVRALRENGGLAAHREFVRYFQDEYQQFATAQQLRKRLYLLGLLNELLAEMNRSLEQRGQMLISNVPKHLAEVVNGYEPHFIYEKTGARYGHFLIDEFQDTAAEQWRILRPLVDNGLAQGQRSFIVGDPKQAIYAWRGGEVGLFLNQVDADLRVYGVERSALGNNWRSLPRVVQFNNSLFCALPAALRGLNADLKRDEDPELDAELARIYAPLDLAQQPKSDDRLGFVRVEFLPHPPSGKKRSEDDGDEDGETGEDWKTQALRRSLETARACLAEGFRASDLAFLVRDNGDVARVSRALRSELGVAVASEALQAVQASPVARLLVNLLRWLARPSDRLALVQAARDYSEHVLKRKFDWSAAFRYAEAGTKEAAEISESLKAVFPAKFVELNQTLESLDLYEQTEELIQLLELAPYCDVFVLFLQEQMQQYIHRQGTDAVGFLEWWQDTGRLQPIAAPDGADAVRVMTVHKSKGLEFPVVILPFGEWDLEPKTGGGRAPVLWVDTADCQWAEFGPALPFDATHRLLATDFADAWRRHRRTNLIEQVNLLYVALTRAVERLYLFAPQEQLTSKGEASAKFQGVSGLLRRALHPLFDWQSALPLQDSRDEAGRPSKWLQASDMAFQAEGQLLEYGKPDPPKAQEVKAREAADFHYHSHPWRKRMVIRPRARDWVELNSQTWNLNRMHWGALVHAVLAGVRHADDAESRLQEQLARRERRGEINAEDRRLLETQLRELLALPQFRDWLSPDWTVRAEQTILDTGGQLHQPDRVLTRADGRAVVIDFKTGAADDSHGRQVNRYMARLREMGHAPVEGWLVYLGETTQIVAVE